MTIIVRAPLKTQEIQNLLDGYESGGVTYKLSAKTAASMEFEVTGADAETAITLAKNAVKATDFGKVLYFSVMEKKG